MVLSVLLGPTAGTLLAAAAFAALKTVPGVAELAAPVLGGGTLRDATDLLALLGLPVLWWLQHRTRALTRTTVDRSAVRQGLAVVLPVTGLVLAVTATTATSCAPRPGVLVVRSADDVLLAAVEDSGSTDWAVSADGGATWAPIATPADAPEPRGWSYDDPGWTGARQVCATSGSCWRIDDARRSIERRDPGSPGWVTEETVEPEQARAADRECRGGRAGLLSSIALTEAEGSVHVVASYDAQGVLVRDADGVWGAVRVLGAPARPPRSSDLTLAAVGLVAGPSLALLLVAFRRRLPGWRGALLALGTGWAGSIGVAVVLIMASGTGQPPWGLIGRVLAAGVGVTVLVTVALAVLLPPRPNPHLG